MAEPNEAEPIEITMVTLYTSSVGIDLSSINLDKVKKHPSLYRRQKSEHHRPVQTSGQTRQRKKKVQTQHAVILRKERRLKSMFTEWNQATSPCGQRQVIIHKLNDRDREERRDQFKRHASQLWQDSVYQPRTERVGSRGTLTEKNDNWKFIITC